MILPKLVARSLRRDKARALCAIAGIAAASGLLSWYLCLKRTADAQAPAAAAVAVAPFRAWIGGVVPPSEQPLAPYGAWVEDPSGAALPSTLVDALPEGALALRSVKASLPVPDFGDGTQPGGKGAPDSSAQLSFTVAELPAGFEKSPFVAQRALLDSLRKSWSEALTSSAIDFQPALFSAALFPDAGSRPPIGSVQGVVVPGRTLPLRVVGYFASEARQGAPAVWTTSVALDKLQRAAASPAPTLAFFGTEEEARAAIAESDSGNAQVFTAASETQTALATKAAAFAQGGGGSNFRRRAASYSALPASVLAAKPEGAVALRTVSVQLDARPGGSPLQGPPVTAMAAALAPLEASPFASQTLSAGTPADAWKKLFASQASGPQPALFSESLFGTRVPAPKIGSIQPLILAGGTVDLVVAGFFKSGGEVKEFPTLYTTQAAIEEISALAADAPVGPNLLLLKSESDVDNLFAHLSAKRYEIPADATAPGRGGPGAKSSAPPPDIRTLPDSSAVIAVRIGDSAVADAFVSDSVRNLRDSLPLSLSLAVFTAIAMLVTVLSSGLAAERRRLAILRCAGLTAGGAARMVALETLLLSLIGWFIGFALAVGALQLFLIAESSPEIPSTVHVGLAAPLASLALSVFAALVSALVPAIAASRVRPLEALAESTPKLKPISVRRLVLALAFFLPIAALGAAEGMEPRLRSVLLAAIGLPCWICGCVLVIHPLMRLVEFVFLRPVGFVLGLDSRLLSRRLSRAPGRAMGAILTISLGLCSFVAIHTWGGTLMSGFVPSPEWPDAIVSLLPGGISGEQARAVAESVTLPRGGTPAAASKCVPLEAFLMPLSESFVSNELSRTASELPKTPVQILGADPEALFGKDGMAPMRFREGSAAEALPALKEGNACVIPAMLSRLTGLHKEDTLVMGDETVLKIVGVVDLNWHMVTSRSLVRQRFAPVGEARAALEARRRSTAQDPSFGGMGMSAKGGRGGGRPSGGRPGGKGGAAEAGGGGGKPGLPYGVVITSEKTARALSLEEDSVHFLWCQFSPELRAGDPLQATLRLDEALRAALKEAPDGERALRGCSVQVHHRDEIADGTLAHGGDVVGMMARLPFWSLIVTCTGIAALLVASARASKRETDVMRAVGMTRGQLARLFLGEALLVIICTLVLSLVGGLLVGWSFTGVTRAEWHAGLPMEFIVPWWQIAKGFIFAFVLSFLMALVPLRRIVR